jgi:hypothetical protein
LGVTQDDLEVNGLAVPLSAGGQVSLKDQLEQIIAAERRKLEAFDNALSDYHTRQHHRFEPMRVVLREIVASVDAAYLKADFSEGSATLELGKDQKSRQIREDVIIWLIQPNYEITPRDENPCSLHEQPGIRIEETQHWTLPDRGSSEHTRVFATEAQAAEYLVREIAKKVAWYRHFVPRRTRDPDRD